MFKHFWLGIIRSLLRRKLHSLINIASLTLGLAVFAFAFLYVEKELSYDRGWPGGEGVYRLLTEQRRVPGRQEGESATVSAPVYPALLETFSAQIDKATSIFPASVRPADSETAEFRSMAIADPAFAELFQLHVIAGSLDTVFSGPGFVAVEESYAAAYPEPLTIGSRITLQGNFTNQNGPGAAPYEVAAIYRLPAPVSGPVNFQLVTLMHDYSQQLYPAGMPILGQSTTIWLRLKTGIEPGEMEAQLPAFIDGGATGHAIALGPGAIVSDHVHMRLQALTDLHFEPVGSDPWAGDWIGS